MGAHAPEMTLTIAGVLKSTNFPPILLHVRDRPADDKSSIGNRS
jgi:hypothetical protein